MPCTGVPTYDFGVTHLLQKACGRSEFLPNSPGLFCLFVLLNVIISPDFGNCSMHWEFD